MARVQRLFRLNVISFRNLFSLLVYWHNNLKRAIYTSFSINLVRDLTIFEFYERLGRCYVERVEAIAKFILRLHTLPYWHELYKPLPC